MASATKKNAPQSAKRSVAALAHTADAARRAAAGRERSIVASGARGAERYATRCRGRCTETGSLRRTDRIRSGC